nr:Holliday junction DNA helicase [bacterium]
MQQGTLFDCRNAHAASPCLEDGEACAAGQPDIVPFVTIVLEGKPVAKGRGRVGKLANGSPVVFTPAHTRKYESTLRLRACDLMDSRPPLDAAVSVRVKAFLPIPVSWSKKKKAAALQGEVLPQVKPDCDNYLKAALDALNGVVFRDDSLVTDMHVMKRYSDCPRLEIEVFA